MTRYTVRKPFHSKSSRFVEGALVSRVDLAGAPMSIDRLRDKGFIEDAVARPGPSRIPASALPAGKSGASSKA